MRVEELWSEEPYVWLVVRGCFFLYYEGQNLPKPLAFVREGEVIGAEKLFGVDSSTPYYAKAVTEGAEVAAWRADEHLPRDLEAKAMRTLANLTVRLMERQATKNGEDRLCAFLAANGGSFTGKVNDVASLLGYTRQHVWRVVCALKRSRVLAVKRLDRRCSEFVLLK